MKKPDFNNLLIALLAAHPEGLAAPELRAALKARGMHISQPTLSRRLLALRAQGLVLRTGKARATRYVFAGGRHRLADMKSRALHEAIAMKLLQNPKLAERALANLQVLRRKNPSGHPYHEAWENLLRGDRIRLLQTLTAPTEHAQAMRQESPFAGVLHQDERRRVLERFTRQ